MQARAGMETRSEVLSFTTYKGQPCVTVRHTIEFATPKGATWVGPEGKMEDITWYVKGVGIVKVEGKTNMTGGGEGELTPCLRMELQDNN